MFRKLLFIVLLIQCLIAPADASNYEVGDTLNVMSTNGLNVRRGPSINSEKIHKIEYQDKVVVTDVFGWSHKQVIGHLNGHWIKVSMDGREGYIFDSYLTKLPIPESEPPVRCGYDFSYSFMHYCSNQIGFVGDKIQTDHPKSWKVPLSNADTLFHHQYYEGASYELVSSNLRIEEAHALLRAMVENNFDCEGNLSEFARDLLKNFRFHRQQGQLHKIDHGVRNFPLAVGRYFEINKMGDGRVSLKVNFPCC